MKAVYELKFNITENGKWKSFELIFLNIGDFNLRPSLVYLQCRASENHQVVLTKEWARNEPGHTRQFGLDHGIFKTLTGIPSLFRTTANIFFGLRGILTQLRGRLGSSAPLGPRWSDNAQQGSKVHKPAHPKSQHPASFIIKIIQINFRKT